MAPPVEVTVLRRYDDFLAIEAEWQALFAAGQTPWPYLRHSWLRACWEFARWPLDRLRVILVREGGTLVMGGVFVIGFHRLTPVVRFLGSGLPQVEDLLWRPSPDIAAQAEALLTALRGECRLPRILRTVTLPATSPLLAATRAQGLRHRDNTGRPSYHVPLATFPDYPTYLRSTGHSLRLDHGRRVRRLAELGAVEYRQERGAEGLAALPWLFDTKRAWLEERQYHAPWLKRRYIDQFFARLLAWPDAPPWWLATLRLDGRIIAASLCFSERGLWVFSKLAHDPAEGRFSPGRTVTMMMLETAFAAGGVTTVDLGATGNNWKPRIATGRDRLLAERIRL